MAGRHGRHSNGRQAGKGENTMAHIPHRRTQVKAGKARHVAGRWQAGKGRQGEETTPTNEPGSRKTQKVCRMGKCRQQVVVGGWNPQGRQGKEDGKAKGRRCARTWWESIGGGSGSVV